MKLYWSSRSPFARKVMIAAHELGLAQRIERLPIEVGMSAPNAEVMRHNPLSRIPVLLPDDGPALTESIVIIEFLQGLTGDRRLVPDDRHGRIEVLRRHAVASGLIEILVLRRNERDRPAGKVSQAHLAAFEAKTSAALAAFEAGRLDPARFDAGDIALACALGYLDFRFADQPWRAVSPNLATWFEAVRRRPSMAATEHAIPDQGA